MEISGTETKKENENTVQRLQILFSLEERKKKKAKARET